MQNIVILSSTEFVFRFLPAAAAVYLLTPVKYRNMVLFLESILFYAAGALKFTAVLLVLTLLNYLLGNQMFTCNYLSVCGESDDLTDRKKKACLILAVLLDAGVLTAFKALALADNASWLPLGISFYIFKMISYQADMYTARIRQRPPFSAAAAYFTMFPQLTQGPIMRYNDGFRRKGLLRKPGLERFEDGLVYITLGLCMKVLLADRIGILWNEIDKIGYESISTPLAWLGAYGYTFRLYYDFWGYSLIAAGAAMLLGFDFIENFHHPYAATGIGDFYHRWHATLGAWFRDYIYIPLGGSRCGTAGTIRNLLIVWLITGLWHGGTLNFVIWGLVLGLLIILEKFPLKKMREKAPVLGRIPVLVIIPLTWVIFAIPDLSKLGTYFTRLFPFFGTGTGNPADFLRLFPVYAPLFAAAAVLCVPAVFDAVVRFRKSVPVVLLLGAAFWYCVYFMVTSGGNTFMYFSF